MTVASRPAWRRSGATVLTALTLVLMLISAVLVGTLGAGFASAQTTTSGESGTGSDAATSTTRAPATKSRAQPEFLSLHIDDVTPTTVTTTTEPVVTVTGTVTNVGDRPVTDIGVRLQRAPVVDSSLELRTSLELDQGEFDVVGPFVEVADSLDEGERKQFTLSLPLRSVSGASLDITEPGVYPLLVNVNGTPAYGGQARLDDARFLLPVLGLPQAGGTSDSTPQGSASTSPTAPVPPDTSNPLAVTLLWPLADEPQLAAGIPGSANEKVRLVDDDLAGSLSQGGRLDQLLGAAEIATGPDMDRDRRLTDSMCLAVDPDLLITVSNMTQGYLVVDDPADPTGPAHDGEGRDAAAAWLERLETLARKMCITAVPFAQVDLAALSRVDDGALTRSALESPAEIVDTILGVTSLRNVTWPDSGVLDEASAQMLHRLGPTTTLLAANAVESTSSSGRTVTIAGGGEDAVDAALFDVSAAAALAAVGSDPQTPSYVPERARYNLDRDSRTARLQDALGAVTWLSLQGSGSTSGATATTRTSDRSMLIVPPQQWSADGDEASAVLSTVATLLRSGLATSRSLEKVTEQRPTTAQVADLAYPQRAIVDGTPESVEWGVGMQSPRIDEMTQALVEDPQVPLTPTRFMAPLREDLVRAMSLSGRRDQDTATATAAEQAAHTRVGDVAAAIDGMYAAVTILAPGGVYTLASEQSPLLLVARNDLPVAITVQLQVDAPEGVQITDIGPQQLPPRGSRSLQVPAEISDSRTMVVDFSLTTESGHELGEQTSVTVRSNAYGQALAIITACAGALLLFLAGRRLWHRFRGQPDRADEGYERQ
ncbi:glycoprotein [Prescottella agglutinans]|uniref:Glycoprotein n=1 Tax=Prescottella agglutinans TaxID=1644129 RepID=A0A438B9U7_9NOCA|nr:glycoprotein [Prescottella agglutinans]RVW07712.1 glycoprotein [Prescottella agglutinans]